jgi:hypothetical protein
MPRADHRGNAQSVGFHARGDQRDLGAEELRHSRSGVQRDAQPHFPSGDLVNAVVKQEVSGSVGAVELACYP